MYPFTHKIIQKSQPSTIIIFNRKILTSVFKILVKLRFYFSPWNLKTYFFVLKFLQMYVFLVSVNRQTFSPKHTVVNFFFFFFSGIKIVLDWAVHLCQNFIPSLLCMYLFLKKRKEKIVLDPNFRIDNIVLPKRKGKKPTFAYN